MNRHWAYTGIVDTGNPALAAYIKASSFLIIHLRLYVCLGLAIGSVALQAQTKTDSVTNTPGPQLQFIKSDFMLPIKNYKVDEGISFEQSSAFEPASAINLNLPVFTRSHLFKKPMLAKDFNLDVSPDFNLKVKRYNPFGLISTDTPATGVFWHR